MKIETKLNEGEVIYLLHEHKCMQSVVRKIKIEIVNATVEVEYICNREPGKQIGIKVDDKFAFKTKDALLKSL